MQKLLIYIVAYFILVAGTAQAGVITDSPSISQLLLNILKFLLYVSGGFAIIGLVVSGVMYVVSAGDDGAVRSAKSYAKNCVIGLVVVLVSLALVKTIIMIIGS